MFHARPCSLAPYGSKILSSFGSSISWPRNFSRCARKTSYGSRRTDVQPLSRNRRGDRATAKERPLFILAAKPQTNQVRYCRFKRGGIAGCCEAWHGADCWESHRGSHSWPNPFVFPFLNCGTGVEIKEVQFYSLLVGVAPQQITA